LSPRPILILSAGRSGSHLLRSFFQPSAAILNIGEFLNPAVATHDPSYAFWTAENQSFLERLAAVRTDPRGPHSIFRDYAAWLVAEAAPRTLLADMKYDNVGPFDALWRKADEAPPPLAGFLAKDAIILHLVRRNPLAQFCSLQRAVKTAEWVRSAVPQRDGGVQVRPARLDLKTAGLIERLQRIKLCKTIAGYWIAGARAKLTLTYEDLLDGDRLAGPIRDAIGALVGGGIDLGGRAGTVKIAPPLAELIANVDAVRAALAESEFAWCIDGMAPEATGAPRPATGQTWRPREGALPAHPAPRVQSGGARVVLLCRELPTVLGASIDLTQIATRLSEAGFRPVLALPQAGSLAETGFRVLQCPVWPAIAARTVANESLDYAELLAALGFADPAAIAAMAAAWTGLIETLRPIAIIADHSPGLIATGAAGPVPLIALGEPATLPPITPQGFPPILSVRRPLPPIARMLSALRALERNPTTNDAAGLAGLFETPWRLVLGLPELDPYAMVRREPLFLPSHLEGDLPSPAKERRLLAILPPNAPPDLIPALSATDFPSEVLFGLQDAAKCRLAMADASHVLCRPEHPAAAIALASGRPRLLLRRIAASAKAPWIPGAAGAERSIDPGLAPEAFRDAINGFMADGDALTRAHIVARWFTNRESPSGTDRIMTILNDLVEAPAVRRSA